MGKTVLGKIFLFILKNFWVILLVLAVWWFARTTAPHQKPDTITKYDTVLCFDSTLADTLKAARDKWYKQWWLTKKLYDALLAKYLSIKPDTVIIGPEEIIHLEWNYIIRIDRKADLLDIYCFQIDSLLKKKELAEFFGSLDSSSLLKAFTDMVDNLDSMDVSADSQLVFGHVNKYPLKLRADEFQIFSTAGRPNIIYRREILPQFKWDFYGQVDWTLFPSKYFSGRLGLDFGTRALMFGGYVDTQKKVGVDARVNFIKGGR